MAVYYTIQLKQGTAAEWTSENPVLELGEPGLETDTNYLKFGDGVTAWNSLAYFTAGGGGGGEANTASNQGSGTSIFYQKSGVDLQFNAVKSENSYLTIALDPVSHDVEITVNVGSGANTVCAGDDVRLSDARTPSAHETSHESGGGDELDFDQLAEGSTYKKFLATERTKLTGIETGADVTDTTNVNAAGASMNSDYGPQTLLVSITDQNPGQLTVTEQRLVGRLTGGDLGNVEIGIGNNNILQIDQVGIVNGDFARFTANGIEGRDAAQVRTSLNVADGADVTGSNPPQAHEASHESGGGDELDFDQLADGTTYKLFLATERTKLTGIATGADVTSANTCNTPGGAGTDTTGIHDNVADEVHQIANKATPVGADELVIEDSAASWAKKRVSITNLPGGADADAIHDNVADEIHQIAAKGSPVSADELVIEDSAASWAKKRVSITNLPAGTPADDSITNAKLANMVQDTIKGRTSGAGTGDPVDLTKAAAQTILNVADGADVTGSNPPQAHEASHESGGGDELDFDQLADGTTYKLFLATERTKLTGIATGADVTGSNAPQAHKNSHDPEDGSDALDTAVPVSTGVANAEGTSHSFARADHVHDGSVANDTSPELSANLSIGEHGIELDPVIGTDHNYSGITFPFTVDVNAQGIGAPLFPATDGHLETCDADAGTTMPCVALALETGTGAGKKVLCLGFIRDDSWSWTLGAGEANLIFVDVATGALTQTSVSGAGDRQQCVGWCLSTTSIWFFPNLAMVEYV